jgi:hypothetical protein
VIPSPTPETPQVRAPWLGFRLPYEIIVSPGRAFSDLASRPEWVTAYGILLVTGLIQLYLSAPAFVHLRASLPPPDGLAGKSPLDIKAQVNQFLAEQALDVVIVWSLAVGLSATVLTAVARFKGATTSYAVYASLAANCLVPNGIGALLTGIATALRPLGSFHDYRGLVTALPDNLALFADAGHTSETLFLAPFDVFSLWSAILLAFGYAALTPVKFGTALAISFALTLVFAVIF